MKNLCTTTTDGITKLYIWPFNAFTPIPILSATRTWEFSRLEGPTEVALRLANEMRQNKAALLLCTTHLSHPCSIYGQTNWRPLLHRTFIPSSQSRLVPRCSLPILPRSDCLISLVASIHTNAPCEAHKRAEYTTTTGYALPPLHRCTWQRSFFPAEKLQHADTQEKKRDK